MTTEYGPKKSSPTLAKAGWNGSSLGLGSGAIIGGAGLTRCILHSTHLFTTLLIARLRFNGQYFTRTSTKVLTTPAWAV
jgi:hypothetical protein